MKNRIVKIIPALLLIVVFNSIVANKKLFAKEFNHSPMHVAIIKYDAICNGERSGLIDLEVSGGVKPYKFFWSDGSITEDVSGLGAGSYDVVISDAAGNIVEKTVIINQPEAISINAVVQQSILNEGNGQIELTVQGGSGSYTYLWSDNSTGNIISNIEEGIYAVKVSDSHNCFETALYRISEVKPLNVVTLAFPLLCHNDMTGLIDLTVSGGVAPYRFYWSDGKISEDRSGLAAGFYSVKVYDASGQVVFKEVQITQPEALSVMAKVSDESELNAADGKIELLINGGKAPFTIHWDNNVQGELMQGLKPGIYHVEVTDKNYCIVTHEALVSSETEYLQKPSMLSGNMQTANSFLSEEGLIMFPVPAESILNIKSENTSEIIKQVTIYSMDGKVLMNTFVNMPALEINLQKFQNGNYIIKIIKDKATLIKLFSKVV